MTREKAIEIIEKHYNHWQRLLDEKICTEEEGNETIEAFGIAIEALKLEVRYHEQWEIIRNACENGKEVGLHYNGRAYRVREIPQ